MISRSAVGLSALKMSPPQPISTLFLTPLKTRRLLEAPDWICVQRADMPRVPLTAVPRPWSLPRMKSEVMITLNAAAVLRPTRITYNASSRRTTVFHRSQENIVSVADDRNQLSLQSAQVVEAKNVAVAADKLTTKIERRSCDNLTTISQAAGTPLPPVGRSPTISKEAGSPLPPVGRLGV